MISFWGFGLYPARGFVIEYRRPRTAKANVMDKLSFPKGLIRYDSLRGFQGARRRWLRPRVFLYAGLSLVGLAVFLVTASSSRWTFLDDSSSIDSKWNPSSRVAGSALASSSLMRLS